MTRPRLRYASACQIGGGVEAAIEECKQVPKLSGSTKPEDVVTAAAAAGKAVQPAREGLEKLLRALKHEIPFKVKCVTHHMWIKYENH